jgi:hypothetical protein
LIASYELIEFGIRHPELFEESFGCRTFLIAHIEASLDDTKGAKSTAACSGNDEAKGIEGANLEHGVTSFFSE